MHISPPFSVPFHPSRSSQLAKLGSLCYIGTSQSPTLVELGRKKGHSRKKKKIYFCFIDCTKAFDCVDHSKLWEILREMGISDHLTCLLTNLYSSQEATVSTGHGTTDSFQIGKRVHQGCILSTCLFNL